MARRGLASLRDFIGIAVNILFVVRAVAQGGLPVSQTHSHHHPHQLRLDGHTVDLLPDHSKPFLYIYELPSVFNTWLRKYKHGWTNPTYEVDWEMMDYLAQSDVRTHNPCEADLFMLPIYNSRMILSAFFQDDNDLPFTTGAGPDGHERCEFGVCAYGSYAMRHAINIVKRRFPFWNETAGASHFSIFPHDHGICDSMPLLLHNGTAEQMFGLSPNGEWSRAHMRWDWHAPDNETAPSFICHRLSKDIVTPPVIHNGSDQQPLHPFANERDVDISARFAPRYNIRGTILEHLEAIKDASPAIIRAGHADINATNEEMARSKFCICPPGIAAWTGRVFKAMHLGCIPVTFFQANAMPFEPLGLDWSAFSLIFDLDAVRESPHIFTDAISALLDKPHRLAEMQAALGRAQTVFNWDRMDPNGAQANIVKALRAKSYQFAGYKHSRKNCNASIEIAALRRMNAEIDAVLAADLEQHPRSDARRLFDVLLAPWLGAYNAE